MNDEELLRRVFGRDAASLSSGEQERLEALLVRRATSRPGVALAAAASVRAPRADDTDGVPLGTDVVGSGLEFVPEAPDGSVTPDPTNGAASGMPALIHRPWRSLRDRRPRLSAFAAGVIAAAVALGGVLAVMAVVRPQPAEVRTMTPIALDEFLEALGDGANNLGDVEIEDTGSFGDVWGTTMLRATILPSEAGIDRLDCVLAVRQGEIRVPMCAQASAHDAPQLFDVWLRDGEFEWATPDGSGTPVRVVVTTDRLELWTAPPLTASPAS